MTIYARNRFVLASFALSAGTAAAFIFLFARALFLGTLEPPVAELVSLSTNAHGLFFSYNFWAPIAAIGFCAVSAPILIMFVYVNFEKTQSQECVYSIAFLLSCLAESFRLLIPIFDLWIVRSAFFIALARIVFFGRLLAPLSFLLCALTSVSTKQYQESGKYFIMMAAFAGVFAFIMPINSLHMSAACNIEFGFSQTFVVFQVILSLITLLGFVFFGKAHKKKDSLLLALGYLLFFTGYSVLTFADSFFLAALGIALFTAGMKIYLGTIHKIYMWD
jgi:hypothetical protein